MSHRGHDSRRPALPHRITFRRLHSDPGKYCFRATPRQHRPLSFGSHQPSRLVGYRRRLCERRTHGGCRRPDRRTQCRRRQCDQARVRPRIDQRRPGTAADTDLDQLQLLCVLDVRRAQRRRLCLRRKSFRAGHLSLAGTAGPAGRHRGGVLAVQPGGASFSADRCAVSGDRPHRVRSARRQSSRRDPRSHRRRLVWHPNLFSFNSICTSGGQVPAFAGPLWQCRRVRASSVCRYWDGAVSC